PGPDLYAALGLQQGASGAEIKNAYDKLKVKWHPDRNRSPEATSKFAEISAAYDVLKDDERRKYYD
ncbi:heat shock protein DnaJ, partial [Lophiostoma macrostomum CBS 122681]